MVVPEDLAEGLNVGINTGWCFGKLKKNGYAQKFVRLAQISVHFAFQC